jgi:hypothetical protein
MHKYINGGDDIDDEGGGTSATCVCGLTLSYLRLRP